MPKPTSRRRLVLTLAGAAGVVSLSLPVGAVPGPRPRPTNNAPGGPKWQPPAGSPYRITTGGDLAYVALAGGYAVATVDVASHAVLSTGLHTDAAQGLAATPDGKRLYIADTGQYDVLVTDTAGGPLRPVHVGPFPQDVAVSPDGRKVYATVTGGDTGHGGSDIVAVIDTETDAVVREIRVGTAPRQVVFSRDGARAYVTTSEGVSFIDARTDRVVRSVHDPDGTQGVAVSPDGRTLYVTNPRAGLVEVIRTGCGKVRARIRADDQPWALDLTPDGSKAYVSRMNAGAVAVVDTATDRVTSTIPVGRLPQSVAVTRDGSEVWVGNGLSGTVSVIEVASGKVTTTITRGTGTRPINAAPLGIAFAPAT